MTSGRIPLPTVEFGETRLCGSCGRLIREHLLADGERLWKHVALDAGRDHAPDLRVYSPDISESEARALDGNR